MVLRKLAWCSGISPDGTMLASGGSDGRLCIANINTRSIIYTTESSSAVHGLAWSLDGTRVVGVTAAGHVTEILNANACSVVYEAGATLHGCAFSKSGLLAVGGNDNVVTILNSARGYAVSHVIRGYKAWVTRVAFSPSGKLLSVGCQDGYLFIYAQSNTGQWTLVATNNHHSDRINALLFSACETMLCVASKDKTASLWRVPSIPGPSWSFEPLMVFKGHSALIGCAEFLADGSCLMTAGADGTLRLWRVSDGAQLAKLKTGVATSSTYHAASGLIAVGLFSGSIELWQTDRYGETLETPRSAASLQPSQLYPCVRDQLAEVDTELQQIASVMSTVSSEIKTQIARESELKRSIANLEATLASERAMLTALQTPEYLARSRDIVQLVERHAVLQSIVYQCTAVLDGLTDCLATSGLSDLKGSMFHEWLCDVGLGRLQSTLKDIDGSTLTMLELNDIIDIGASLNDATSLQLHGFIAHSKFSVDPKCAPPAGSVLDWSEARVSEWIFMLGPPFASLSLAGWHGPTLCSLTPPRVIEASGGEIKAPDAVKFINLIKAMRSSADSGKGDWVAKWSGTIPIERM